MCHSDLHFWDGFYEIGGGKELNLVDRGITLPLTMGHENVGVFMQGGYATHLLVPQARHLFDIGRLAPQEAAQQIHAATGGGAWGVIDFVDASQTVKRAIGAIVKGGTVIVVRLFGGEVTLPMPFLPLRAMTLRGSSVGSHDDLAELLELVQRTEMPQVPIRTRPLDEVSAGSPRIPDMRDRGDAGSARRSAAPSAA